MNGTTKLLGALLIFGVGGPAFAVQFSFKGDLNNRVNIYTNQASMFAASETIGSPTAPGAVLAPQAIPETWAEVKYRLQAEISTDDKMVRGVYMLELGAIRFGSDSTPGALGRSSGGRYSGDGVNVETRFAYIDFGLPATQAQKFRATFGLQPVSVNKYLWQETAMGINLKADAGPAGLTLAWYRGFEIFNDDIDDPTFGDGDNIHLRVALEPSKELKGGLFGLYQRRQPEATPAATNRPTHLLKGFGAVNYDIVNLGVDAAFTAAPLLVNVDFIYQLGNTTTTRGTAPDFTTPSLNVGSFLAHVDVGVNLGAARVMYTGWYASGDGNPDDDDLNNFVATDVDTFDSIIFGEGGYTDDNYFTEAPYFLDKGAFFNKLGVDFKATETVTVGGAILYVMTAQDLTLADGSTTRGLGTEIDAFISYKLNANLELALNAGYLFSADGMDFFETDGGNGTADANVFRSTARARFTF